MAHHLLSDAVTDCRKAVLSQREKKPMKTHVWLKPGLWGAVCRASIAAIVGIPQLGWQKPARGGQLARERADTAVVAAVMPFFVDKDLQDTGQATLGRLRTEQSSCSRSSLVRHAGWAALSGWRSHLMALWRLPGPRSSTQ